MSELTYLMVDGMACDSSECGKVFVLPEPANPLDARKELENLAGPLGWSMWVGRTRRTYCSDHGPRPGSKLRKLWGREVQR